MCTVIRCSNMRVSGVGGWVGGWVNRGGDQGGWFELLDSMGGWVEEIEAVRTRCCTLGKGR